MTNKIFKAKLVQQMISDYHNFRVLIFFNDSGSMSQGIFHAEQKVMTEN